MAETIRIWFEEELNDFWKDNIEKVFKDRTIFWMPNSEETYLGIESAKKPLQPITFSVKKTAKTLTFQPDVLEYYEVGNVQGPRKRIGQRDRNIVINIIWPAIVELMSAEVENIIYLRGLVLYYTEEETTCVIEYATRLQERIEKKL